jgi:hypothetical protein
MTIRFPRTRGERPQKVVPVQKVVQAAAAEATGRRHAGDWRRSFMHAVPMDPLLVYAPVGKKGNYFIVDFRSSGKSTARAIYRAADGVLAELAGLVAGQTELSSFLQPAELPAILPHREIMYPRGKKVPFGTTRMSIEKELVWAPCDQSLTPMEPFYVVHAHGGIVYVRVDGVAFGELTEYVAGG